MDRQPAKKMTEDEIVQAAKDEARQIARKTENESYVGAYTRAFKDAYLRIKKENQ